MKNQTLYILIAVVLVLGGIMWWQMQDGDADADATAYANLVSGFDPSNITQISIATQGGQLRLESANNTWTLDGYQVALQKVNDFLNRLLKPDNVDVISETNTQDESLGIASDSATLVTVNNSEASLTTYWGIPSTSGGYVRIGDNLPVFLISGGHDQEEISNPSYWLDTVIMRIPQNQIETLTTKSSKGAVNLQQIEGKWINSDTNQELDTTNLTSIFQTIEEFSTDEVEQEEAPSTPEFLTVSIKPTGQDQITLRFFKIDDENVFAVSSNVKGRFKLPLTKVDDFELSPQSLVLKTES
jgi:hypothetical protein